MNSNYSIPTTLNLTNDLSKSYIRSMDIVRNKVTVMYLNENNLPEEIQTFSPTFFSEMIIDHYWGGSKTISRDVGKFYSVEMNFDSGTKVFFKTKKPSENKFVSKFTDIIPNILGL